MAAPSMSKRDLKILHTMAQDQPELQALTDLVREFIELGIIEPVSQQRTP
jgi:hypothetical protein